MNKSTIIPVLTQIYSEMSEHNDYRSLSTLTDVVKINNLVHYYINYEKSFDSDDINIIGLIIKILQSIYNNTDYIPPITDEDYDTLYETFHDINESDIVGAENPKNKIIATHRYPDLRGTLDKTHFFTEKERGNDKRKSIEGWYNSIESKLNRKLTSIEEDITIFPKFDGVSIIFECNPDGTVQRVLTRGDTDLNEALDLTSLFGVLKFKPLHDWKDDEFGVKTEMIMTQDNYEKLCKKYGKFNSRRSAVSSIINSIETIPDYLKYVTVVPLRMQNYRTKELIVHPDAYTIYPNLQNAISMFDNMKTQFTSIKEYVENIMHIPVDGVVLYINDKKIQSLLGRADGKINKYEVAYKFPPEEKKSILLSVEFCIGLLGTITPVAKIEPVKINNNTISSISLGSIDRFESLHLREGDEVIIKYDIIPYLYTNDECKKSTNDFIKVPTHCEYCNEKLIKDPVLKCVNTECTSRVIGKIVNFIDKMSLENISISTVTTLFKEGYLTKIEDLFNLEKYRKSIVQLDGFGDKSFSNIIKGINSRTKFYDYEILGAIGIPDIGRKIFKKILNIYYIDDLVDICVKGDIKKLTSIYGIKEKTANKIAVGIITNLHLIKFLQDRFKIKHDDRKYSIKVVFTKVRDMEFEKFLDSKDVLIMDNYTKDVDMVITKDKMTESNKVTKAIKDGKEVVSIDEAYELFGYKQQVGV